MVSHVHSLQNYHYILYDILKHFTEHVAIKIIDKTKLDDESRKILSREVACMERLCHPSVIRLFEVIDTHQSLHLIMECASEGNVQDRVNEDGPLGEDFGRKIFVQVASAVNYMVN